VAPSLTFAQLERLLTYLLTFFLAREVSARPPERNWLPAAPVIAVGTLEGLLGLTQYLMGMGRAYGTYVNPNHFAALMHMALPMAAMGAAFAVRRRHGELTAMRVALACLLMACSAILLFGSLFSLSRMGLACVLAEGAVIGFLAIAQARKGFRSLAIPVGILAVALALVLIASPGALADRFRGPGVGPLTDDARAAFRAETLRLFAAYPWFGCGLGGYVSAIQKFRHSAPTALLDFAHNDYLQLLAELGLFGFAPLALSAGWIFAAPWRAARNALRSRDRYLAIACAASLSGIALDCAVDFDFYIPANMVVAAWVAGLGFGAMRAIPGKMAPHSPTDEASVT
jgi:O-antigen ligase